MKPGMQKYGFGAGITDTNLQRGFKNLNKICDLDRREKILRIWSDGRWGSGMVTYFFAYVSYESERNRCLLLCFEIKCLLVFELPFRREESD